MRALGLAIHNHLPQRHRYRDVMHEVLDAALRDLPGAWEVSVQAFGRAWFRIELRGPDVRRWIGVPVPEGPSREVLAACVRSACLGSVRLPGPGDALAPGGDIAVSPATARERIRL